MSSYFRSILCLNGVIPQKEFFEQYSKLSIIAADGAGTHLIKIGIKPKFIIGDLDSFSGDMNDEEITFLYDQNQNTNDFEKCIFAMKERKFFPSLLCGAFGKDIEHSLNNMNQLVKYGKNYPMICYNNEFIERPQWCVPIYNSLSFSALKGEKVSIIPCPTATISTQGLKWELNKTPLSTLDISSLHNQVSNFNVAINVHEGQALLVTNRYIDLNQSNI